MSKYGEETFLWPALPAVQQKPLDPKSQSRNTHNFLNDRNGHMTLAVFLQGPGGMCRSEQGKVNRAKKRREREARKRRDNK